MPDTLKERLRADMNEARRARDKLRTLVLTTTLAELRNREIEVGREATDADVIDVVQRAVRKRGEAAEQFRAAGRTELAGKEEQEAALLGAYLPPTLDEAQVRGFIREAIAAGAGTIGAVMGAIMPKIKGSFDGRDANRIASEELGT